MGSGVDTGRAEKPQLTLLLAAPRGFCAGVDRAIRIVELALQKYGAPVYVRHEIVHNRVVVERLEKLGARFIEELDEAPTGAHVIFSAHGVPKSVPVEAQRRQLSYLDATCPLPRRLEMAPLGRFPAWSYACLRLTFWLPKSTCPNGVDAAPDCSQADWAWEAEWTPGGPKSRN